MTTYYTDQYGNKVANRNVALQEGGYEVTIHPDGTRTEIRLAASPTQPPGTVRTQWQAAQEVLWQPMAQEAQVDLAGSNSQTTTLTAPRTLTFTGTVTASHNNPITIEVIHGGFTLTVDNANGGADFTAPTSGADRYFIHLTVGSNGIPVISGPVKGS